MISFLKKILKPLIRLSPIPLTAGERIDRQTKAIIERVCHADSNCIDIGAHKGEILDIMISAAPNGEHFAFEPLPPFYSELQEKYKAQRIVLFNCALSDETGESTFQYVKSNPAYSGILKREYDRSHEDVEEIVVNLRKLDDCIPVHVAIDFIKIDVEGAELLTLKGGKRILQSNKPVIVLEHGEKGAGSYGYQAADLWHYFNELGYQLYTLKGYLKQSNALTLEEITNHYNRGDEFYFVAV